jgi:hypothetical protein
MPSYFTCGTQCPQGGEHSWDGPGVVWTMPCPNCIDVATDNCPRCENKREIPSGGAATCSKCGLDAMNHSLMNEWYWEL